MACRMAYQNEAKRKATKKEATSDKREKEKDAH